MKNLSGNEIRKLWLEFFKEKGHKIEPSASLIPLNDPTLLWINSGVAALKKYFDGSEVPPSRRITNAQKAIRTNDIENVGHTARHHTFFEMLGCFSIGDYFRKEIIAWAVEILTSPKYFDMDKEKLYMTYHPSDIEAKKYWMENGIEESHLIPLEHNFWQIGEGPCGPNTEVFYDRGEKYDVDNLGVRLLSEEIENDRYIEIWGIVFSQYNAVSGVERKDYKELPSKNIDTGAGLERIACIMQEKETNFETDLFWPIIEATQNLTGQKYESNTLAFRVIADHIRAVTFALSDGEMFSNEGRGYVLRRLLRRAERYGKVLGLNEPFLYSLVDVVVKIMKDYYPYLEGKKDFVKNIILTEENKFIKTLSNGEAQLKKMIQNTNVLSGADVFKLYDTYGFPKELTMEICQENNVEINLKEFDEEMKKQKERARSARGELESMAKQSKDLLDCTLHSEFNYQEEPVTATVIALFKDGNKVDSISDEGEVMFDVTNFYSESGGQVSDSGEIKSDKFAAKVTNVSKAPNKQHLHSIKVYFGTIKVGDKLTLSIDISRREKITRNHSATHLLQAVLEEVLGDHISQSGSYVNDEYLRFDFTHYSKISEEELLLIEEKVNQHISSAIEEKTLILPIDEAKKIGAKCLFNDKYGDVVRVVTFGDVSKEFCGGTHVKNTKDIGVFIIESEESIASGIRRIQARTSINAYELIKKRYAILAKMRDELGAKSFNENEVRLKTLLLEKESLKKENASLKSKIGNSIAQNLDDNKIEKDGIEFIYGFVKTNRDGLLSICESFRSKYKDYVLLLIGEDSTSYPLVSFVSGKALSDGYKADEIIRNVSSLLNGKGGGRKESAFGNAKDLNRLSEVETLFKGLIK
ncbi:MAG: alanine--tRNA ligase [Bacilli bacterium]